VFPDGFHNDVQVVATVLSMDPDIDADIPALWAALGGAGAVRAFPSSGPIGAARVGWKGRRYPAQPTASDLTQSQLHLVVAGTEHAVLMVESEPRACPRFDAERWSSDTSKMQVAIRAIKELAAQAGKRRWSWQAAGGEPEPSTCAVHAACAGRPSPRVQHHGRSSSGHVR